MTQQWCFVLGSTEDCRPLFFPGRPNGKKLVFAEWTENAAEIFVCDIDGKNKKQLTRLGAQNTQCAWSPDGKKIASSISMPVTTLVRFT